MRRLFYVLILACSQKPSPAAAPGAAATALRNSANDSVSDAQVSADASVPDGFRSTDAGLVDGSEGDAGNAEGGAPILGLSGKMVFHAGDSTLGGEAGLNRALRSRFKAEGAKYASDTVVSASVVTFDRQSRFHQGVLRSKPDIVIVTLGANDVFIPSPEVFAVHIRGIVKKIGARECYWVGPPTWKKDTGIVEVIRNNCAPCKFFDSRGLEIARAGDRIHPTDKGGAFWAERVWEFFVAEHKRAESPPGPDAPHPSP